MSVVCFIDLSRDAHQKLEKTRRIEAAKSADPEYWAFCVDLHKVHVARASCEDAAQKMETMVPTVVKKSASDNSVKTIFIG